MIPYLLMQYLVLLYMHYIDSLICLIVQTYLYLLDMNSMLNLCEYFGGQTIKIPTIEEFEDMTYALTAYQLINIDGKDESEVMKDILGKASSSQRATGFYEKLCTILHDYKFSTR